MVKLENNLKQKRTKIGILGGTFDPAHKGHLEISKQAKKILELKNIIWAITKQNPFKNTSKTDFKRDWYHISVDVFDDARPPKINAKGTKKKIENLLFKNKTYLFLKNLDTVDAIFELN